MSRTRAGATARRAAPRTTRGMQQPLDEKRGSDQEKIQWDHRGKQRERRDHHRNQRDRERVGERAGERHLAEEQERRRREADGDRPLHASPLREARLLAAPARADVEDERNGAEGEPQAGGERRPRVGEDHGGERERQRAPGRDEPARPERRGDHRHHPEGALRGHREAGEQRIGERRGDRRGCGRLARGEREREPRRAPPSPGRQPGSEPRDERHVQPRDAHEVRDPGAVEEPPLLRRDRALVAHRERGQDARRRRGAERFAKARAHRLAHLLDPIKKRPALAQLALHPPLAHIAGRADAALEEPGLVVEAVRVREAPGAAQAQREFPALPGTHGGRGLVPADEELLRQPHRRRLRLQLEAGIGPGARQAGDHAHHLDVAPLERRVEPVRHAPVRACRRPEEAGDEREGDKESLFPTGKAAQRQKNQRPPKGRQRGLEL